MGEKTVNTQTLPDAESVDCYKTICWWKFI